jgi:phosphoribosylamine-glycine ligase
MSNNNEYQEKVVICVGLTLFKLREHLISRKIADRCILIKDASKSKLDKNKRFKNVFFCNFSDNSELEKVVSKIKTKYPNILFAITTYEEYISTTASINSLLGIRSISKGSAKLCTDKKFMREAFIKYKPSISPMFNSVDNLSDLLGFANTYGYPLIIKPANLAKSLLIYKCSSEEELMRNYSKCLDLIGKTYRRYAPLSNPSIIVEEFIEGTVHSVDVFIGDDYDNTLVMPVVDYQTGYDIGQNDNFHFSRLCPSDLDKNIQRIMESVAIDGVKALKMLNTAAHVELILDTKSGKPKIVEIGARNGGYRDYIYGNSCGADIFAMNCMAIEGKDLDHYQILREDTDFNCSVLEIFPHKKGFFSGIENFDNIAKLKSFDSISVKYKEGEIIGKSSDGFKMTAVIKLKSKKRDDLLADISFIKDNCKVIVK